ncbi:helicase [Corynebacterium sp. LK29]|uniref:DEAD/DEAH box helicase family protein n=1 Tax=Corynebacterium sp. LK29 TaxID=2044578 RepID=UPI001652B41A|nr:DEAD/DEAH box helicase family protein [Corynebacterium sp. LK29]MBC6831737.1 helicase [Corynebacterium sp. LK29]
MAAPRSNFGFVGSVFPGLLADCRNAEGAALSNPRAAAMQTRFVAEQVTVHICKFLGLETEGFKFADLAGGYQFRRFVPQLIQDKIKAVRQIGNTAAHNDRFFDPQLAARSTAQLYDLLVWAAANTSDKGKGALPKIPFDPTILEEAPKQASASKAQLEALQRRLEDSKRDALLLSKEREELRQQREEHLRQQELFRKKAAQDAEAREALEQELAELRKQLEDQTREELVAAQADAGTVDTSDLYAISEEETRKDIIDPMLAEAGFSKEAGNLVAEYQLPSGARVDYVLFGSDGVPLAVVEAKKTAVSISAGREQAREYADELEQQFGRRPIIYYTNGYEVRLWDDAAGLPGVGGYQPRAVEGYATEDELYLMISKRSGRKDLAGISIDRDIAGRIYQEKMIRAVTENYGEGHRRALLVMATGTGKTRVSIALVKLLQQAGWVKNVLFLADRTALVNQAAKNFQAHYEEAGIVNLLDNPNGIGSVYVSTYQTMVGLMGRDFDPYAFDLIVVDEAHRSIYRRYKRIFDYFDSLLLGLTATPRDEVDRNTYSLFQLPKGKPTGEYGLEEATAAGYLVPYKVFSTSSVILSDGIVYDELSEEEKIEWDNKDWGTDEDGAKLAAPEGATASEINSKLINQDTIDQVITQVLANGIKVAGADRIGKTIFFARSQAHAEKIGERLQVANPTLRTEVITHESSRSNQLIEAFESTKPGSVDIAVSVDMLDTGIDVPAVVNLVFFKPVHSKTKFWQMIGRGTRTCKNLFGEGMDKTEFYVFDYCDNFHRFSAEASSESTDGSAQKSLQERLFLARLRLIDLLGHSNTDSDLADSVKTHLRNQLSQVPVNSPLVGPKTRPYLEKYLRPDSWNQLKATDIAELEEYLADLPFASAADEEFAKRFDLLILKMQEAVAEGLESVDGAVPEAVRNRVMRLAENLLTKLNVPEIAAQAEMLENAASESWWEGVSLDELELLRRGMRSLVRHVDRGRRNVVITDIEDEFGELQEVELPASAASFAVTESSIEQKIRELLEEHGDSLVLQKLHKAIPLTPVDVESLEQLVAEAGIGDVEELQHRLGMSLSRFVRTVIGLEEGAARAAFADLIDGANLNSVQLEFMNRVITGLVQNGIVTVSDLFNAPYNDYGSPVEVFDGSMAAVIDLKNRLEKIERSADAV